MSINIALSSSVIVSTNEMKSLENLIFDHGMPIASLMEKVSILVSNRIKILYFLKKFPKVGFLIGSGHNGGDGLVIARELYLSGYNISIYCPFAQLKSLTACHYQYAISLGIKFVDNIQELNNCDLIVDGLFGFGLTRPITENLAENIRLLNQWQKPVISIDIPSGIDTDTGQVLGVAIRANHTLCLGLWKRAFFQDAALPYLGKVERIDFGIPSQFIEQVLTKKDTLKILLSSFVIKSLPLSRSLITHKYKQGRLLLICGSNKYAGSAILAGLGARSSGIGMLSISIPKSLKNLLISKIPEALIIECPENDQGVITHLPDLNLSQYSAIAIGCGLTTSEHLQSILNQVLQTNLPVILDADGLNLLAKMTNYADILGNREAKTILTPHLGEFKRLFPHFKGEDFGDRLTITAKAAQLSNAIVLLKGSKTIIANPQGKTWVIQESTPALAKGGSGDVLTGLIGGFIAQKTSNSEEVDIVASSAWLHQQGAILASKKYSELGVDGVTLAKYISKAIAQL